MPRNLVDAAASFGSGAWLATVPASVADLADRWSLKVAAPFQPGGRTAWVAPARRSGDVHDLVLKVGWAHPEAVDEAAGLREWDGHGAVRLHSAVSFGDTQALLMERCRPGTSLATRPEDEQDRVIAGLLRTLWRVPAGDHPFRPLQSMCDQWADEFKTAAAGEPRNLDPGLERVGIAMLRSLPSTAPQHVLLCTDLHADNVLAAHRVPWLMIDPKPYIGDPCFDPVQHMLNCEHRLHDDPRELVARMADLAGVDPGRLANWLFARCVHQSRQWPEAADIARRVAP
jgi:streptomycin 6-kinase